MEIRSILRSATLALSLIAATSTMTAAFAADNPMQAQARQLAASPSTGLSSGPIPRPSVNYASGYHNGMDGGDHQHGIFDR